MTCRRRYLDKISEVLKYEIIIKIKIEEAPAFDMKRNRKKKSEIKRPNGREEKKTKNLDH